MAYPSKAPFRCLQRAPGVTLNIFTLKYRLGLKDLPRPNTLA